MSKLNLTYAFGPFLSALRIGGEDYTALVDTGATVSFLVLDDCLKLGLKAEGGRNVTCIHGESREMPLFVGNVELAGKALTARVAGLSGPVRVPNGEVSVVLGRNILNQFKISLDWPNMTGQIK